MKDGARVAVCLTFDADNEFHYGGNAGPGELSNGEYGATTGLPRILAVLDHHKVPASFYIPAGSAILHPEIVPAILKSGVNEIGVHGWTHACTPSLANATQEHDLLVRSVNYLRKAIGKRPVGYRAPCGEFGPHTLEQIRQEGFLYDSSLMARDEPYELLSKEEHTGLIELPSRWEVDDYPYFGLQADGSLPDPESVFKIYRAEFDAAYTERTLLVLVLHPAISGQRSRAPELDKLIAYMKSKPGVWFATMEEVARYIKTNK